MQREESLFVLDPKVGLAKEVKQLDGDGIAKMTEMSLQRIEEKIDKITAAVGELSTQQAVVENRTKDLEIRREESHLRANKFSDKLDHIHDCMHRVQTRVEITHKILYVIVATILVAVINELVAVI